MTAVAPPPAPPSPAPPSPAPPPPAPPPPSALETLAAASAGLLLPSESDAPLAPVTFEGEPSPVSLRAASGADGEAPVEELPLEALFAPLERGASSQLEQERVEAEAFRKLHTIFREQLREARVYRVGRVEVEVWILGKDEGGRWVGLRSQATET